jgi:hypothetical protein
MQKNSLIISTKITPMAIIALLLVAVSGLPSVFTSFTDNFVLRLGNTSRKDVPIESIDKQSQNSHNQYPPPKKSLRKDESGAIIWGKGKEIYGQIHIADSVAEYSNLWIAGGVAPFSLASYMKVKTEIDFRILRKKTKTPIGEVDMPAQVSLTSKQFFSLPLLLFYGKKKVVFNQREVKNLRKYLVNRGGFLFVDEPVNVMGMEGNEFLTSIKEILKRALPEYPIVRIPYEHEIYHNVYEFSCPPRGHAKASNDLEGIFIDGRLAVILSDRSYSTLWFPTFSPKVPELIIEVFQFSANVIVYAVTHGKISDYSGYTKYTTK